MEDRRRRAIREGTARVRSEGAPGGEARSIPQRIRDRILRLRARGLGSQSIADQANAWPVPTARGAVVGQHGPRSLSAGPTPNRRQTSGPTFSRTRWNEMQGRGSGIVVAWFGEYHRAMRQVWILAAATVMAAAIIAVGLHKSTPSPSTPRDPYVWPSSSADFSRPSIAPFDPYSPPAGAYALLWNMCIHSGGRPW